MNAPISEAVYCNTNNSDDSSFCAECGTPRADVAPAAEASAEKPAAAEVAPPAEPVINKKPTAAATIPIPQVATPKSISIEDLISAPNGNKE